MHNIMHNTRLQTVLPKYAYYTRVECAYYTWCVRLACLCILSILL